MKDSLAIFELHRVTTHSIRLKFVLVIIMKMKIIRKSFDSF